jgi:SSS family solute:Na+ symporter
MTNVTWYQILNWSVTIIPIWFVGMTLYQRIYASKGPKEAKAWIIAGVRMANNGFHGSYSWHVSQGSGDKGMFDGITDAASMDEMGLPVLFTVLPVGLMGLMLSSYFSAILSTADSCLMAGNRN